MTTIYDELRTLCADGSPIQNPEQARHAISTAEIPGTPDKFRREMYDATAKHILPVRPPGMGFSRDCFWSKFRAKFVYRKAWMGSDQEKENAAAWLRSQRETAQRRGNAYPPAPSFRPVVVMPQPWDGKEERPGRVPIEGK